MHRQPLLPSLLLTLLSCEAAYSQDTQQRMPREDVVEIPAIGDGLCLSNVFQTNMVLQRDKPVSLWGWANAGETVTVTFDGNEQVTTAADDRAWPAQTTPNHSDH